MAFPPGFDPNTRGTCRVCGKTVAKNRYYCDDDRPAKTTAKAREKKQARSRTERPGARRRGESAEDRATRVVEEPIPVIGIVNDAAADLRPSGRGKPTVDETSRLLGTVLMYVSIFLALYLMSGDPGIETEEDKDGCMAVLQLTKSQATSIMHPVGRLLAETTVWAKHGRRIVEHSDVVDAIASLYEWGSALAKYNRAKGRRQRQYNENLPPQAPVQPARPAFVAPTPAANGHVPREASFPPAGNGAEPQGVVMTPHLLERLRMHGQLPEDQS